ncbi:hypothetical protein BDY19DRAFT_997119 [Irpex rosettiformis]|uniref:Uncharacterized protein n=1 Tax=Irpex rosettiformis TaxID=378272 RepID=A0ACB8TSU7_9APHY|nr:hypothetical protein BDY19DRAFT_997119 [Irpex rosettiformis]
MADQIAALNAADPSLLTEQRICPGCKKAVVTENGGVVVAFGQSFFHIDCFRCAKCNNQVTADTNLLLLSDGSPVCSDCSYCCNVCGQPILDEAIMTGEDSYHAHCFNCRVCKKRIDELVFAKTSQGIYCMPCHNERVAKSRRREKEKKERERRAAAAAAAAGERPGSSGVPSTSEQRAITKSRSASAGSQSRTTPRSSEFPPGSTAQKGPSSATGTTSSAATSPNVKRHSGLLKGLPSSPAATRSPPPNSEPTRSLTTPLNNVENLSISSGDSSPKTLQKAKSYDDHQLNNTAQQQNADPTAQSTNGLLVPESTSSRKEKRRSINPALVMTFSSLPSEQTQNNPFNSAPNTPLHLHMDRPTTPSKQDFGHAPSPLREEVPNSLVSSPPSYARDIDTGKPLHISNLARLQSDALQDRPTINRSRSASSTEQPTNNTLLSGSSPLRSPMRMSFTLDRVPQRTTSRPEHRGDVDSGRSTPQLTADGWDASNGRSSSITRQRSFDSRHRHSSSSLGQTSRAASVSRPSSPAYRADVPRGIESGTDTEAESEETCVTDNTRVPDSLPPLPPKEAKGLKIGTRPPHLKLDTVEVELDDRPEVSQVDSEDFSEDFSHEEGALVESTSHSTYIAPALPPIRFSVVGSDFSDLLNTVGGSQDSVKALEAIAAKGGKANGVRISGSTPSPQPRTPTSDRTVLGDAVDVTPVQHRREPTTNGVRKEAQDSQHLTSDFPSRSGENARPSAEHSILRSVSSPDRGNATLPPKPTLPLQFRQRDRGASDASLAAPDGLATPAQITVTPPPEKTGHMRPEIADIVVRRLSEALKDSRDRGSSHVKVDMELLEAILSLLKQRLEESHDLKHRLDGVKRTSQQAMEGLTVAQTQYDKELRARRDAEAEIARLRVLLSGQAVRLAAASGETMRQEAQKQLSQELSDNLSNLERSLSQLRLQRDMALAEVEELSATKSTPSMVSDADGAARLSRALSVRFDNIKNQYQDELLPLTKEKEALSREIAELKAMRDAVLGETAAISARNEALAQLNAQYAYRTDGSVSDHGHESDKRDGSLDNPFISTSTTSSTAYSDESADQRWVKPSKAEIPEVQIGNTMRGKFRWPGSKAAPQSSGSKDQHAAPQDTKPKHNFQLISVLRVARCDHCGDKMWGSQYRCTVCNVAVHTRCGNLVHLPCTHQSTHEAPSASLAPVGPSMFGRDLAEQVRADSKDEDRVIPVIVEKCIDAVDALALEYEGIYRKTGGSSQSRTITQLFERGDYTSFDLKDSDRFNDICSVTSVLKNYFRSLPDPLLTFDLHEQFIAASTMKEAEPKTTTLKDLVTRLPPEHYNTTRALMLHLHRVSERSDSNLMHAQNLGVVFGPTLMRSRDPAAEFSDMAGKTLTVKWLVENAPSVFQPSS